MFQSNEFQICLWLRSSTDCPWILPSQCYSVALLLLLSMLYWSMRLCDCCVKHSQKTPSVWSCSEILLWSTHPKVNTCWTKYSWLSLWYTLFWFSSSDGSQKGRVGCYWHLCWPCLMSAREAGTLVRKEQTPLACNCLPTPPKETPPADVILWISSSHHLRMQPLFLQPKERLWQTAFVGTTTPHNLSAEFRVKPVLTTIFG